MLVNRRFHDSFSFFVHVELLHVLGREFYLLLRVPNELVVVIEDRILDGEAELCGLAEFFLQYLVVRVDDPGVSLGGDFLDQVADEVQFLRRQVCELSERALEEEIEDVVVDVTVLRGIDLRKDVFNDALRAEERVKEKLLDQVHRGVILYSEGLLDHTRERMQQFDELNRHASDKVHHFFFQLRLITLVKRPSMLHVSF